MRRAILLLPLSLLPWLAAAQGGADGPADPPLQDDTAVGGGAAPEAGPPACADRGIGAAWSDRSAEIAAARPEAVAALEAWSFPVLTDEQEAAREGIRTDGILILQGGEIVYERYDRGYGPETPHLTWSMSKTFTNALVGIAVADGLMSLEDSVCDHVEAVNPDNCVVTIEDLLEFGSGIEWRETYEGDPPTTSSVIAMLYGEGRGDMAAFVTAQPRRAATGSVWQYSSGDSTLMAAAVGAALEPEYGRDFAWEALFEPLGMDGIVWERDGAGALVGSSYLFGAPRSLARFGQLWLDDGCWGGDRILPEGWVADSTRVSDVIERGSLDRGGGTQGRQVWLNQPVYALGDAARPWPDVPPDAYAAQGHWRQMIVVIPSYDAVIVRTGDDRDGSFAHNDFLSLALSLIEPVAPIPAPPEPGPATGDVGESEALKFETGLLGIGSGYGAKMACSCAWVMGRDEDDCREWIRASPDLVKVKFDHERRVVTAKAVGMAKRTAAWVNEREGCVLE